MSKSDDSPQATLEEMKEAVWLSIDQDVRRNAGNERALILILHMWAERIINHWLQVHFKNHSEIIEFDFSKKRKILFGLGKIKDDWNQELKTLNKIRVQYAHELKISRTTLKRLVKEFKNHPSKKIIKEKKLNDELTVFTYCSADLLRNLLHTFWYDQPKFYQRKK